MFRVHCNKCYRHRSHEPALKFHFARCHHIICDSCRDVASKNLKCPVCSLALRTIPISENMPSSIALYFEDPIESLKLYRKISKFQFEQRASDNLAFWHQMQELPAMERQLEGYKKLEAQLNEQINIEKMRIAEMRDYLSYHEQKKPQTRRRTMDDFKEFKRAHKRRRPRTPSLDSSDLSQSDESLGTSFGLTAGFDFESQSLNLDNNLTMTTSDDSDNTI